MESILEDFHQQATKNNLNYLIIGGFAASFWGKPRFTADIDYAVSEESFEIVEKTLAELGCELVFLHPEKTFAHYKAKDSGFRVDIIYIDGHTWELLTRDSELADFGGSVPYPVIGALHLIAMKLHAAKQAEREESFKDINDIAEILIAQKLTYKDLEKSDIIEKHGSESTIGRLEELLKSRNYEF